MNPLRWLAQALRRTPKLNFTANTFIVWEPCSHSHAEVVPGYVKYLLDLGFDVAVFMTPERFDEGLFARFSDPRLTCHRYAQPLIRRMFRRHGIGAAAGILITTARKISGRADYAAEQALFAGHRLLLVEHDVALPQDSGALTPQVITLRRPHYRGARTTVVNPHYFGTVTVRAPTPPMTRFITIGAMRRKRRNTQLLIEAVAQLHDSGCRDFRVTVIGRGDLRGVPLHLRPYFVIKGRLRFADLYAQLEAADFFLTLLDPDNPAHERYVTTGTSGSFQLIFGFTKPALIPAKFAAINGFTAANAIVYGDAEPLSAAMRAAITMTPAQIGQLQANLAATATEVYAQSLANLRELLAQPLR